MFSLERLRARFTEVGWLMILLFSIEGLIFILAPFWAYSWAGKPFPGFVVEQTLVIANYGGEGWSGRNLGMNYPQRVISLEDKPVSTPEEFMQALSSFARGETIAVHVVSPDGARQFYPAVTLGSFPEVDLLRLFWVPYLVGLAFFILGVWVYRVRGYSPSSRAFSYFSMCAALSSGLLFDLITTHNASVIWFVAVTQQGSTLATLALLFPEEWTPAQRFRWLYNLPYVFSAALAIWGLLVLYDSVRPWAYVTVWRLSYFYAAFGIIFFLGVMLYRLKTASSRLARQQIWVILIGSLLAFIPIGIFLVAPMAGVLLPFITVLFLPFLLFLPLSISIAILRYRLWDIDLLINQTLVYGALTLLLGSLYFGSIIFLQTVFIRLTGESSPFTIALSTLVIAVAFSPLRRRVQNVIDQRFFRKKYEAAQALAAFSTALRREVDLERLSQKLIAIIQETVQPAHTALLTYQADRSGLQSVVGENDPFWQVLVEARDAIDVDETILASPGLDKLRASGSKLIVPLVSQGELVGLLNLGPRLGNQYYTNSDIQLLGVIAGQAAPALRIAHLVHQQQIKAQDRQRLDHELRVARFIQHLLLPKQSPVIEGWKISGHYQPAKAVGGDFFDFVHFENGTLGIVIGDATGHGVPAALVMASARSMVRAIALQLVSPSEVLHKVNDLLLPAMPSGMFVTCLYALVEPKTGLIRFANAGHNLPCLLNDGNVIELRATGMPLGLLPDMEYEEKEAAIQPGDCVVFYSDGLVEAHNAGYEMFGVPRLKQLLCKIHNQSGVIENLLAEWQDFNGMGKEQEDDMTLVTLQWTSEGRVDLESGFERQGIGETDHTLANAG